MTAAMASFDYPLPAQAIAQVPAEPRSAARLLVASSCTIRHCRVVDLPNLLEPGDVLVVNETRVLPARLVLRKETGGAVEVLLLEQEPGEGGQEPGEGGQDTERRFAALVRRGRRVRSGTPLFLPGAEGDAVAEVGPELPGDDGRRLVTLLVPDLPERDGAIALPPYVRRPLADPERYQTVYGRKPGSVAAPTAGLHLTKEVLDACRVRGIAVAAIDLAVGLDTFKPVRAARPEDHVIHTERYAVPPATMAACQRARRVVAVGTTTVRALETAAASGRLDGRTSLFIHGEYPFRIVDVLLTNFHLPRSSLLLMLDAFCGARWRDLYQVALDEGYMFLSFGDAMLVDRERDDASHRRCR